MSDWRTLEIYSTFLKVTGELEIVRPDRVSDAVNRFGEYLQLRRGRAEPISVSHPLLSRSEPMMAVAKAATSLICPVDDGTDGNPALWREKMATPAVINTQAFSMIGDVHLEPRHSLRDHLERFPGDFIPISNISALWITSMSAETHTVQRSFALLNPAAMLTFAVR
ncbi:MAG: hypothetical protein JF887_03280 [Candidatus Dormibacteraeota bacterium]|uniref:Uncharacterized protein n=1 Tax=Candidatus Amunia macphersoniae TaxID=3127014 RepID=A0A934KF94_9BACT|nr:hypothetical protein [Candidatus Dormibacteraeota bacterium]